MSAATVSGIAGWTVGGPLWGAAGAAGAQQLADLDTIKQNQRFNEQRDQQEKEREAARREAAREKAATAGRRVGARRPSFLTSLGFGSGNTSVGLGSGTLFGG